MTWTNRFKMIGGLLAVMVLVGLLTVVFSQRKGEATSASATVVAESYPVGSDYAGAIVESYVAVGDEVEAGDPIARIQSNALQQALDEGTTVSDSAVFQINSDNTLTITSTVDGIVDEVLVPQGGYAASGATIATIDAVDTLFVAADFLLGPNDFSRVENGAAVRLELPDSEQLAGTVRRIDVRTENGSAQTTIEVESDELVYGGVERIAPGMPVSATLQLTNKDPLAQAVDGVVGGVRDVVQTLQGWSA